MDKMDQDDLHRMGVLELVDKWAANLPVGRHNRKPWRLEWWASGTLSLILVAAALIGLAA